VKKAYRRVIDVTEVADYEDYKTTFTWHPIKDAHIPDFDESQLLPKIAERNGITKMQLLEEMERRKDILHWMRERNIRSYKDVAAIIAEYYARPKDIYEKVHAEEEAKAIAADREA
jgi:flagellar protein FlaI